MLKFTPKSTTTLKFLIISLSLLVMIAQVDALSVSAGKIANFLGVTTAELSTPTYLFVYLLIQTADVMGTSEVQVYI